MDFPINNEELATIVKALTLGGDTALYQKLNWSKRLLMQIPEGHIKKYFVSLMAW